LVIDNINYSLFNLKVDNYFYKPTISIDLNGYLHHTKTII